MSSWKDAIKEAYASAPKGVVIYETIQIHHESFSPDFFLVDQRGDKSLPLAEGEEPIVFTASGFRFTLPPTGENGTQDLRIAIDNVDRRISDFIKQVVGTNTPVVVTYRPYLSNDLTKPQLDPPLQLNLRDLKITTLQVSGRASYADILNMPFPNEYYTRTRFPSLGN
jgi:hypothetical protein